MKTTINLAVSIEQAQTIKIALKLLHRLAIGDISHIASLIEDNTINYSESSNGSLTPSEYDELENIKEKLEKVEKQIGLAGIGINSEKNSIDGRRSYEILKVISKSIVEATDRGYGTVDNDSLPIRLTNDEMPIVAIVKTQELEVRKAITGDDIDSPEVELSLDYVIYENKDLIDTALSNIGISNNTNTYNAIMEAKTSNSAPLSVLKSLYVEPLERNNCFGTEMMDIYLAELKKHGASSVLVADLAETNHFDLISFYQKYGYEIIDNNNSLFPIMLRNG